MRGTAARACFGVLAAAWMACAAGPPGVWLDVPFVAQKKNGCGAASLTMVMQYWAMKDSKAHSLVMSEEQIETTLDPHERGISNQAMVEYLNTNGYRTFAFSGNWNDLRENLARGRPLIVALGPRGARGPLHYVVAAGIDWEHDFVFVNDPAQRKMMRETRSEFEDEWKATGNWTLLAVPRQE